MIIAHLKQTMKPMVSFFKLMCPPSKTFSAWMVSIPTNVPADFALSRVVSRPTINVNLEPNLHSCGAMTDLDRLFMCCPINPLVSAPSMKIFDILNDLFDTMKLLRNAGDWRR